MPCRMIDGEAIAGSKKLRKVSECWRIHYPLWLTLAEVNGTFEVDVDQIWGRLYSMLFPSITREDVAKIIAEFVSAGLLSVWNVDDHEYGFFVGMEKPGRLLSYSHQKRYKKIYPDWPGLQGHLPEESGDIPEVSGTGKVREGKVREGKGDENDMALADKLRNEIYERTGKVPKLSDWLVAEFRKRVGTEKEKLAAFREYLNSNPESEYPLHEFLDSDIADQFTKPTVVSGVIANPALVSLASKIFTISDYAVSGKSLTAAENLLKVYPELDIINAFRYFYGKLDDFGRKHAVRDFFEKGAAEPVILAMKEYQQHQEDVIRRAEAVPVAPAPVQKEDEDDGQDIDF